MRPAALRWLAHRLSGAVLFVGLLLHFYVMHFMGEGALSHAAVMARLSSPLWIAFNVIFLAAAIYHGFLGLWGILLEHVRSERVLAALRPAVNGAACGLLLLGIYILAP